MSKCEWQRTTIEELRERLAMGEWPRVSVVETEGQAPVKTTTGRLKSLFSGPDTYGYLRGFMFNENTGSPDQDVAVAGPADRPIEVWIWKPLDEGSPPVHAGAQHMAATLRAAANMLRELRDEPANRLRPSHAYTLINAMIDRCNAAALGVAPRQDPQPEPADGVTEAIAHDRSRPSFDEQVLALGEPPAGYAIFVEPDGFTAVIDEPGRRRVGDKRDAAWLALIDAWVHAKCRFDPATFGALERIAAASRFELSSGWWAKPGSAKALADRVAAQLEGFRLVAVRAATARAEILACESLIGRAFERLAEVDPQFVEDLRRHGS